MKYIIIILFLLAGIAGRGQAKGDTTKDPLAALEGCIDCGKIATQFPPAPVNFHQIVFLMQQNKELSDRLDRAENKIDTLNREMAAFYTEYANDIGILKEEILALQRRPYLQLDTKASHPALLVLCPDGSCGIILRKF